MATTEELLELEILISLVFNSRSKRTLSLPRIGDFVMFNLKPISSRSSIGPMSKKRSDPLREIFCILKAFVTGDASTRLAVKLASIYLSRPSTLEEISFFVRRIKYFLEPTAERERLSPSSVTSNDSPGVAPSRLEISKLTNDYNGMTLMKTSVQITLALIRTVVNGLFQFFQLV